MPDVTLGNLTDDQREDIGASYQDEAMFLAYATIVGLEYFDAAEAEEQFVGTYSDDREFAMEQAEQGGYDFNQAVWPETCIDWEYAARELMYDYSSHDGFYFRNA